jgi:hypothetical protein
MDEWMNENFITKHNQHLHSSKKYWNNIHPNREKTPQYSRISVAKPTTNPNKQNLEELHQTRIFLGKFQTRMRSKFSVENLKVPLDQFFP